VIGVKQYGADNMDVSSVGSEIFPIPEDLDVWRYKYANFERVNVK